MGCLFACFGACKHRKRRHLVNATHFEDQRFEATEDDLQVYESTKQKETKQPITVSREKHDEHVICSTKKKVTFDLNVNTRQESPPIEEVTDNLLKHNEKKEIEKEEEKETPKEIIKLVPNSITRNVVSHVPNNRYQNCAASEDESEDLGLEGSDLDSDSDILGSNEKILVQEESSESLFSLSIDSRKHVCEVELGEREVNSPMPVRRSPIQEVHSVLNPVENLTQWKVVKARATLAPPPPPSKYQAKENINLMQALDVPFCPVKLSTHSSVLNSNSKKVLDQEMAVDTSLSSWLVESETTPMSKNSTVSVGNSPSQNANKPRNHEDRSILAALEVEELQELSPRRSRSQSPDEPIIGTVGSYWSCTGKIMDSDSSSCSQGVQKNKIISFAVQDERVKWGSILPFEARLEKALNTGIAEV